MRKKILALGLCIALALSATACGKDKDSGKVGKTTTTSNKADMSGTNYTSTVKLGQYEGLEVGESVVEVSDETIKKINCLLVTSGYFDVDTTNCEKIEKAVETFDIANINYVGKVDGEEFQGGSAENFNLGIGTGAFIEGFEDGLKGVNAGETVDLNLKFPDDYQNEELAGKDVVFTVTVNYIFGVSDEFVKDNTDEIYYFLHEYFLYGKKCETKQEFDDAVRTGIKVSNIASNIIEVIAANSEVEFDETEVNVYLDSVKQPLKESAISYSMTFEDLISYYYGMSTEEEFDEYYSKIFKNYLVLIKIAKETGIQISDEQYETVVQSMVDHSQGQYTTIGEYEVDTPKQDIVDDLLCGQVYYKLADTVKVVPDDQTTTMASEEETTQEETTSAAE